LPLVIHVIAQGFEDGFGSAFIGGHDIGGGGQEAHMDLLGSHAFYQGIVVCGYGDVDLAAQFGLQQLLHGHALGVKIGHIPGRDQLDLQYIRVDGAFLGTGGKTMAGTSWP
jgi:hypothetical protein